MADANVYRFSSKEYHVASGLIYYLYRYYDANLQRWLNRDPIQEYGGINLFRFVKNRPTTLIDAWGLTYCSAWTPFNVHFEAKTYILSDTITQYLTEEVEESLGGSNGKFGTIPIKLEAVQKCTRHYMQEKTQLYEIASYKISLVRVCYCAKGEPDCPCADRMWKETKDKIEGHGEDFTKYRDWNYDTDCTTVYQGGPPD